MRIGVYFSPWGKVMTPTGVGRHAVEMTTALARRPDVVTSRFTTQGEHEAYTSHLPEALSGLPVNLLPGSETLSRWMLMGLPGWSIDRYADVDWVYCPKEQPVTTRKVKLAVNVHDTLTFEASVPGLPRQASWRSRSRWKWVMRRIRQADLVTTVSEFTRVRLMDLFQLPEEKLVVAGNGVSDCYFREPQDGDRAVLEKYGLKSQGYFLAVGSLTWRKGGDLLIEAARLLRQQGVEVPVIVTGKRHDADLKASYDALLIREPDCPVRLLGFVPDEEQLVLLSHSTALVFPSRYEGFGIPALEAMAAGTIVICSRSSALPEVVGDAGIYVEPLTAEAMADRMLATLNSPEQRQKLIAQGRQRVEEYRWSACAGRLVTAIHERS